jgi:hypothetical protein
MSDAMSGRHVNASALPIGGMGVTAPVRILCLLTA